MNANDVPGMRHWGDDKANNNIWNLGGPSWSANIGFCVSNGSENAYRPENTRIWKPSKETV
jgi:hypothetical protein